MTRLDGYPRTVCIVSLMGVRRFLAVVLDCVEGVDLEVKLRLKVVCEFYTHFYTLSQWSLGRRMGKEFLLQ